MLLIPGLIDINSVWKVLPPGVHIATLAEIKLTFAINKKRAELFDGFCRGVKDLRRANCKRIYLDGSFVTEKIDPGDFDSCWDPAGVNPSLLDPVLLDFSNRRENQKLIYKGEFFPSTMGANGTSVFIDFFQTDKISGAQKGIICVQF